MASPQGIKNERELLREYVDALGLSQKSSVQLEPSRLFVEISVNTFPEINARYPATSKTSIISTVNKTTLAYSQCLSCTSNSNPSAKYMSCQLFRSKY